jgi:threonine/homoserine/homoserine lactone efflux protein
MLLKGITIGFSIAAPVGPIGLLCIRRSLGDGILAGLATGLGAATADAVYGCVAGFGLTAVSRFLIRQQLWLGVFGGAFLCYLGIRILVTRPAFKQEETRTVGLLPAYGSTLLLTLANPLTILSFAAVFAGFGLGAAPDYSAAVRLVAGVFIGSALWWLVLSGVVGLVRASVNLSVLRMINWVSGGLILGFGLYTFTKVLTR